jgi:hypothetical protein
MPFEKYGLTWPDDTDLLDIEFYCIRNGGKFQFKGKEVGEGLFYHYKESQKLLWPTEYHNYWTDLILKEVLDNTITCVMAAKDCGKTRTLSKFCLTDYFIFPNETLVLVSSTTLQALETRVWGDLKMLFALAKRKYSWLPGNMLDSKRAIATDDLEDKSVISRDLRKGILCIPCKSEEGEFMSISTYVGMKQKRRRHLGDEFQFMGPGMLNSIGNMNSGDFKGMYSGNPIGQNDPFDKITEPEQGWDALGRPNKTTTWTNRKFKNSRTICLYGPDSPAIQEPNGAKKYPGLLTQDSIERVIAGFGKDSPQYYSQCLGIRIPGLNAKRVITIEFCRQFKYDEKPIWDGTTRTKIFGLDAAYGGIDADRCIGGHGEFGKTVKGIVCLWLFEPKVVPINLSLMPSIIPEDQIAIWTKQYNESNGIPAENTFYDSTGRGSLGPSMAKHYSVEINPIEFGGPPSDRPVTEDTYVYDPEQRKRRLKLCNEHYSKFVTELWWTVRYGIQSEQIKGITEEAIDEAAMREWSMVAGNKIEIESKRDMKSRTGFSPDIFDWVAIIVEGARRRGFKIMKMANVEEDVQNKKFVQELVDRQRKLKESHQLNYAA